MSKSFNKKAKDLGYNGNAMVGGKLTKRYKKFYKEAGGGIDGASLPLPNDIIYNTLTERFVDKSTYITKKGKIRAKYAKKGFDFSKGKIISGKTSFGFNVNVGQYPLDGESKVVGGALPIWYNYLKSIENQIAGKLINIQFNINNFVGKIKGQDVVEGNYSEYFTFKVGSKIKSNNVGYIYCIWYYKFGRQTDFFSEASLKGGRMTISVYKHLTPVQKKQQYLDGLNYHCVLSPILKYYTDLQDNVKAKSSKKKYQIIINKLKGKQLKTGEVKKGFLEVYKKGCYLEDLENIVKELPINITIYSPIKLYENKQKPLFQFKTSVRQYALKEFEYINTRSDHLDLLVSKQNETEQLTKEEMADKLNEITQSGDSKCLWTKRGTGTISHIYADGINYALKDDSVEIISEFEKNNNLTNNKMFYNPNEIDNNNLINGFVLSGVHYNCCVDFDGCEDLLDKEYKHIDMEKAYFNFAKNPLYDEKNAFLCRCSYYANSNIPLEFACNNVGYYRIDNIDLTGVDENTCRILFQMGMTDCIYKNGNVYPHIDLKLLNMIGAKFDVVEGVYGLNQNINFGEDMKTKYLDGVKGEGAGLYSSWTGLQNAVSNNNKVYMKGTPDFLATIKYDMEAVGKNDDIYVNEHTNEAVIKYDKKVVRHRSHITGYITAYQRTSTLLQLFKLDVSNIIRVVVDGIYYVGDTPELVSSFREQNQGIKSNSGGEEFISNPVGVCELDSVFGKVEFEEPVESIIYTGAGGTGKTHLNMNKKVFQRVGYLAHSNKLCRATKAEFKANFVAPYAWILQDNPDLYKKVVENCDVLLIDEASTLRECDIKKLKWKLKGIPLIFMGDITHQTLPIDKPKPYKDDNGDIKFTEPKPYSVDNVLNMFDKRIHLTKNFRFMKCKKQTHYAKKIREDMDNGVLVEDLLEKCKNTYGKMSEEEMLKELKYEDILLSSRHINKDDLNEKIQKILKPKYFITNSKDGYYKGDVLDTEPTISKSYWEIKYCYTIHSVQGETLKDHQNLYIDSREIYDSRVLYTAISRAKYAHQIKFF